MNNKCHHIRESLIPNKLIQAKIGVLSLVIPDMWIASSVQTRSTSASPVTSMDISQACVSRNKYLSKQKHPKHTNCKLKCYPTHLGGTHLKAPIKPSATTRPQSKSQLKGMPDPVDHPDQWIKAEMDRVGCHPH